MVKGASCRLRYCFYKYLAIFASLKKCTNKFVDTRSRHTAISFIEGGTIENHRPATSH